MGLNTRIAKHMLRHEHYWDIIAERNLKDLAQVYSATINDLGQRISAITGTNPWRKERLKALKHQAMAMKARLNGRAVAWLNKTGVDLVHTRHDLMFQAMDQEWPNSLPSPFTRMDWRELERSTVTPMLRKNHVAAQWNRLDAYQLGKVHKVLDVAAAEGWGVGKAAAAIRRTAGGSAKIAKRLARTHLLGVANAVHMKEYKNNSDVIKGVQHIASLDDRTCLQCGSLDGKVYKIEANAPALPLHPGCRCCYAPVTRSWRELGVNIDEIAPSTRATMDGQVSAKMAYGQWFAGQPDRVQRKILGPSRYQWWDDAGKPELKKMVKPRSGFAVKPVGELAKAG